MYWYKRNIGDYYKKAGRLTMLQHGAYTLLLDACYDRECFPTIKQAEEWAWASNDEEKAAVKFVLERFFELEGDIYIQHRLSDELVAYQETAKTNKRIANEREEKRRQKTAQKKEEDERKKHEASTKRAQSVNDPLDKSDDPLGNTHEAPPNQEPIANSQEPEPEPDNISPPALSGKPDHAMEIFDYWVFVTKKKGATKLTADRKKLITARFKEGYSVDDIKQAIYGCSVTPHNMGINDRNTKYDGLEIICKNGANLERFIENAINPPDLSKSAKHLQHDAASAAIKGSILGQDEQVTGIQHKDLPPSLLPFGSEQNLIEHNQGN